MAERINELERRAEVCRFRGCDEKIAALFDKIENIQEKEYVTMTNFIKAITVILVCLASLTGYGLFQSAQLHKEIAVETKERIEQRIAVTNEVKESIERLRKDISAIADSLRQHHEKSR